MNRRHIHIWLIRLAPFVLSALAYHGGPSAKAASQSVEQPSSPSLVDARGYFEGVCMGAEAGFSDPGAEAFTGSALFQVSRSTLSLESTIRQPAATASSDYSTFNPAIITHWHSTPFLWTMLLAGFVLMIIISVACMRYGSLIALFLGMDSRVERRQSDQSLVGATGSQPLSEADTSVTAGCLRLTHRASGEDVAGAAADASVTVADRMGSTGSVTFADEVGGTASSSQPLTRSDPSGNTTDESPRLLIIDASAPSPESSGSPTAFPKTLAPPAPVPKRKTKRRVTLTRTHVTLPPLEDAESSAGEEALDWHPLQSMGFGMFSVTPTSFENKQEGDIRDYIETENSSWQLFFRAMGAIAQVWGVLAFMYWSLLTNQEELMDCLAHPHGRFVGHLCTYTHACLRGFPILAINVTLVCMIRMLIQTRIYYSLLRLGYVLDFADTHIMHTQWPLVFGFSMMQGGVHLLLKMYYEPNPGASVTELARKFVVPGAIFLSFFLRYAEIENTLVPLNRIAERDYTKDDRSLKFMNKLQVMNERVIAFWARKRDVVGDVQEEIGRAPKLEDIFENLIATYDEASERFYATRKHYGWGLFRSLWPASLLVDRRLDFEDPKTRSWLYAITTYLAISFVVSLGSTCFFIASIYRNFHIGWMHQKNTPSDYTVTETLLANAVLLVHALIVIFFSHRAIRGMFYFEIQTGVIEVDLL